MDYNVRYNIDINESEASRSLSKFANTVQRSVPPIIKKLEQLQRQINTVTRTYQQFNRTISKPKTVRFNVDKGINTQLRNIQKQINAIKGKTVTIKTNQVGATKEKFPLYNRGTRGIGRSTILGATLGTMGTLAAGYGIGSIVKDFSQYENTMVTVRSILQATDKDALTFGDRFAEMGRNVRNVGVNTKFTTTEVAGATKYLAMAGLGIKDINNSILPIANLATISDTPLDRIADIVTNIQTAYGIDSGKMGQVADILAMVTASSNTTIPEMGEAMKFAAPMMSLAGVSFNEAASAIGLLANAGIKGTLAGTNLRRMMIRLLNPTEKALKVLNKYKISLYDIDKTGKTKIKSLTDIFTQFKGKDLSVQDIQAVFDVVGGNAANNILSSLKTLPELAERALNSTGFASMVAKKKQDETLSGQWAKVTSQFTETGLKAIEPLQPEIKRFLEDITKTLAKPETIDALSQIGSNILLITRSLGELSGWVMDNWDWIGNLIIGGIIFKQVNKISDSFSNTAGSTRSLTSALGGMNGKFGAIPTLIDAAIAALVLFAGKTYLAKNATNAALDGIQEKMNELQPGFAKKDEEKKEDGKKKSYWESIGFNYLGNFNGQGDVDQLTQYAKVLNKRGEEAATVDYTNSQEFFKGLENLPTSTALEALKARRTWIDAMKQTPLYTLSNTMDKQLPFNGKVITGKTPEQFTEGIAERSNEFTSRYNSQMNQFKTLDSLRIGFFENVLNNKAISTAEAFKLFQLETGIDPTFKGELLTNDQKKAKVTEGFNLLRNKGVYDNKALNFFQNAMPDYLKEPTYGQPIYPNKNVRIDPTKGTEQDRINSKPYQSWKDKYEIPFINKDKYKIPFTNKDKADSIPSVEQQMEETRNKQFSQSIPTNQSKAINGEFSTDSLPKIHCDSLISIGSVTGADLNDIEKFKNLLSQALLSIAGDQELV